jgi:signal transduction histidine kinase
MNILIVDDRVDSLYLLEKQLGAAGYRAVTARNGVEALQKLQQQSFDLIISDILMPQMDGYQLCHEVKKHDDFRRIPFVFYTATYTDQKDEEAGIKMGASRFILKPQEPTTFINEIKEVLRQRDSGKLPAQPGTYAEGEYLKTYNERLVNKLEQKIEQLNATIALKEREVAERLRAEQTLVKYQQDLQSLASRQLILEERERRKFSQLLHDHIGQNLSYAKMKLDMLRKIVTDPSTSDVLKEILTLMEQMSEETRSLTYELSPPLLYEIGLDAALEWLCEQFQKRYGLVCSFEGSNMVDNLSTEARVALFQSVRELLFNIVKHAQAKAASVTSACQNNQLRLTITDNGIGMQETRGGAETASFGLFSIRERMRFIGGQFELETAPGAGSRVSLVFNVPANEAGPMKKPSV